MLGPALNSILPHGYGDARVNGFPLPDHYKWDDVLMVIGASKFWKTRYVGMDGFILTKGGSNQYNWRSGKWVDYDKDMLKPFDCGSCHTRGNDADVIISSGGFIRHHEQWPEFRRSRHFSIGYDCNTYHTIGKTE